MVTGWARTRARSACSSAGQDDSESPAGLAPASPGPGRPASSMVNGVVEADARRPGHACVTGRYRRRSVRSVAPERQAPPRPAMNCCFEMLDARQFATDSIVRLDHFLLRAISPLLAAVWKRFVRGQCAASSRRDLSLWPVPYQRYPSLTGSLEPSDQPRPRRRVERSVPSYRLCTRTAASNRELRTHRDGIGPRPSHMKAPNRVAGTTPITAFS